jgi:hypothetical protein
MTQVTLATIRRLNISQARGLVSLRLPPVNWTTIGLNLYKSSRTTRVDKLQLRILKPAQKKSKTCTILASIHDARPMASHAPTLAPSNG